MAISVVDSIGCQSDVSDSIISAHQRSLSEASATEVYITRDEGRF